jgi:hypothetical protein
VAPLAPTEQAIAARYGEAVDRIVIDGLDLSATGSTITLEPGTSWGEALDTLGATFHIEHVPEDAEERVISVAAAEFLRDYKFEEPGSVLAIYWRYKSLEAEEFDTVERAERFLENGEEYGSLSGEAIVSGTEITVLP